MILLQEEESSSQRNTTLQCSGRGRVGVEGWVAGGTKSLQKLQGGGGGGGGTTQLQHFSCTNVKRGPLEQTLSYYWGECGRGRGRGP